MRFLNSITAASLFFSSALLAFQAAAQTASDASEDSAASDLAKQLANPIASLISVPLQWNYDENFGPDDKGYRSTLNIQPVAPFALNDDWNLIVRTIIPVIKQEDVIPGSTQSGLGDIVQSFFFSPSTPVNGVTWGVGPVFLYPTATDDLLGAKKWGAGPTAVVLKQQGPWTYGGLVNHIWSVADAGDEGGKRDDISSTFVQPFATYSTPDGWSFTGTSESTYNWKTDDWAVPLQLNVAKVVRIGNQAMQVGGGVKYWADPAENGAEGWGGRLFVTLLFPK